MSAEMNPEEKIALIQIENDSDPVNIACEDYRSVFEIAKIQFFRERATDNKGCFPVIVS